MRTNDAPSAAGAYADKRYKSGLHNYRLRTRWIFRCVFGPVIVAGVAS